jgi:hypothetical protein
MGSEWILGRLAGRVYSGFNWLRIGTNGGSCERGDEPSGSGAMELVICMVLCGNNELKTKTIVLYIQKNAQN